jgi:hypothetical protein
MVTIYRQRVLEPAGWVFWHCFTSTWTLRKEEILKELLERISAMGIEPLGMMERAPSLVENEFGNELSPNKTGKPKFRVSPHSFTLKPPQVRAKPVAGLQGRFL